MKLKLYLGERQSKAMQDFENLALILSQAFGGETKKKGKKPKASNTPKGEVTKVSSAEEMKALWREIF